MRCLSILLGLLLAVPAAADPLLFSIRDHDSTVWLLGSVHALRASDYPLDARIESAYANAGRIVLEVKPSELKPEHIGPLMMSMGRYESGNLADAFSEAEFRTVREQLAELGVAVEPLQAFEPWLVALQVFGLNLARHGFTSAEGVDTHYAARAAEDGKATDGLERAAEQFALFDNLPLETQKTFLLETLKESDGFRAEMEKLVDTWRRGDAAALEHFMETEFAADPELRESMLDARNRRWIEPITEYLDQPGETLIIVGALHLVGDQGVVELLRKQGYDVERVTKQK